VGNRPIRQENRLFRAAAQELTPDLVILDFSMPEMNGLETAAALRYVLPAAKI
jgi:DNA-binding NarL/FixJ family response regulator